MILQGFTESIVEDAALAWLASLGYAVLHGPDIAAGENAAERLNYGQVVLEDCLQDTPLPKLISGELRVAHPKTLAEATQ